MKVTCHQCVVEVVSFVQHEMNPLFPIGAFFCFMIFGYMSFILCPLTYLITQNAVHRCSRCLQILGIKRCFGIPDDLSANVSKFLETLFFPDLPHKTRQMCHCYGKDICHTTNSNYHGCFCWIRLPQALHNPPQLFRETPRRISHH
jgi:hypothetical protein